MHRVPDRVRATCNQDGGVALDIQSGNLFRLNPVGALILESLAKGCSEAEIAITIARQYDVSEETVLADVRDFLKSLEKHKLVSTQATASLL
jgi:hypothetical protein